MIVLAIDTCDLAGSVAIVRDRMVAGLAWHNTAEEYSSWLLPTVGELLKRAGMGMADMDAIAVAAGPGSFTGVRVGLTTVKAWSEVYGKPIVAVSKLEAVAVDAWGDPSYVAAWIDAHRGEVFGALYKSNGSQLVRIGDEMVISPSGFLQRVTELTGGERVTWASADPVSLFDEAQVEARRKVGEEFQFIGGNLAGAIGAFATAELAAGRYTDAPGLDANYIRRSDAEIFWKGGSVAHGR